MHKNLFFLFIAIGIIFTSFAWAKEVDLAQLKQKEIQHKCKILQRLSNDQSKTDPEVIEKRKAELAAITKDIGSEEDLKSICK